MQTTALNFIRTLLTTLLTEKMVLNLLLLIAKVVVETTSNDMDNKIYQELRTSLDTNYGTPGNLYAGVKEET